MKPMYLILDPEDPEVRVLIRRPVNDLVLDLFAKCADIEEVLIANGLTNEPHARYQRGDAGVVTWSGRVISRPNTNPVTVGQSPNVGQWVDMGIVTPSPVPEDRDVPPTFTEDLITDDPDSKWSQWFAKQGERERFRDAVCRLVEAGIISIEDVYPR